jgi:hypothetical protein
MATSGTVGATFWDVTTVLEHAFRRCGILSTSITAEMQLSAKENLFFLLSDLANRGISLWCVQKNIIGLSLNQEVYNLPVGTVDTLEVLYRTASFVGTPTSATATTWSTDSGSGLTSVVTTIGVTSATAQTLNLAVDTSPDGSTWTQLGGVTQIICVANTPMWFDINNSIAQRFWRVRETVLGTLTLSSAQFGYSTNEVLMAKLNRDDYVNLPNKNFAGRPLQFWYDKQVTIPRIWLWPTPNDATAQIVVWNQRQIQDVGALTNQLEIPQRWLESVIFSLAHRQALEIPVSMMPPGRMEYLESQAEKHLQRAEAGESDGSNMKIMPNIRAYTA